MLEDLVKESRIATPSQKGIPIAGPWITELEVDYVSAAVRGAWYEDAGEFNRQFEDEFAKYVGRKYAIALPSCTSGIHLLLAALDLKAGDEVIVPESTWIATAAPVVYTGANVVFADVDPTTWCLDTESVRRQLSPGTRAIIAVDLYGGTPSFVELEQLAASCGIPLIEDAAEAIGSESDGRKAGSLGLASVFSFHGTKTLTTGEGGMLVTDDTALYDRIRYLADHARTPGDVSFFQSEVAFKYKMSSLQAALGLAQLERLPALIERKRQIFEWYQAALDALPLQLNSESDGSFNTYWMVTAILAEDSNYTGKLMQDELAAHDIASRPFFHPLSSLPAFQQMPGITRAQESNPVSYRLARQGLNLPSALMLNQADVAEVSRVVRDALRRK